ncbi:MAG: flagellar basal body-associated protein FliL [Bacteriovoracia bacterium]
MSEKKDTPPAAPSGGGNLKKRLGSIRETVTDLFKGLGSKDRATRKMSVFFVLSLVGALATTAVATHLILSRSKGEKHGEQLGKFLNKQKEAAEHRIHTFEMGKFLVEVTPPEGAGRPAPGIVNMAEIVIVIECEEKSACTYVENHLTQARDQVATAFTALEQADLMTILGKQKLKAKILQKLNSWLPGGKIRRVYFSNVIIG